MAHENILVIEDEEDIQELLAYNLRREGYTVTVATSGEEGLQRAFAESPQAILLDIMLPGLDGLRVCKLLRQDTRTVSIPIIMVTAKGEETDIVAGLEMGAEDYITKPFSPKVLTARLRAVLRRGDHSQAVDGEILTIHNIAIHPGRHEVHVDGQPLDLTSTEFRLLHFLARRPGWVFTRYQIVDAVHGQDYPVTERSVDVQVAGLRKKLSDAGKYIETVRGVGYRFKEGE